MCVIGLGHPGTHITSSFSHQQHLTLAGMVQNGMDWLEMVSPSGLIHQTLPDSPGKLVPTQKAK